MFAPWTPGVIVRAREKAMSKICRLLLCLKSMTACLSSGLAAEGRFLFSLILWRSVHLNGKAMSLPGVPGLASSDGFPSLAIENWVQTKVSSRERRIGSIRGWRLSGSCRGSCFD